MGDWTRRRVLKAAGAAGVVVAAGGLIEGHALWQEVAGAPPPEGSTEAETPDRWRPAAAGEAPILLVMNPRAAPATGAYLAEILTAEGLNAFRAAAHVALQADLLERFPLVLLSAGPLDTAAMEVLRRYVARGGNLIAMRPPAHLADLFGVDPAPGQTADGSLRILPDHPAGRGFPTEPLQFHGPADHYRRAGASEIARLAGPAGDLPFPAVTVYRFGEGQAAMWAFDLAWSVALMRQGNPARRPPDPEAAREWRTHRLFEGWIDLDRIGIPQADEQMRLLSQLITWMLSERLPLPRLWYFPQGAPGVLVATGDAHNTPSAAVEEVLRRTEQRGGGFSVYYAPLPRNALQRAWHRLLSRVGRPASHIVQPEEVQAWRARGHEFGIHPYVEEGLETGWQRSWEVFTGMGYGPVPPTVRTHRVLWSGWVETARVQARFGIRMNLDYYLVGPLFRKANGEWAFGYFTGSGLPMRFVDESGQVLNIYQQPTLLVDEQLIGWTWEGAPRFPPERAVEISRDLLGRVAAGMGGAIAIQAHVDPFAIGGDLAAAQATWLEGVLDAACAHGLPIWSAQQWLAFVEARAQAAFEALHWDPASRRLRFQVRPGPLHSAPWAIGIPSEFQRMHLDRVEINGREFPYQEKPWRGIRYAWVHVPIGSLSVSCRYAD